MSEPEQQGSEEEEVEPAMYLSMAGKRAVRKAVGFAVDIEHAEALDSLFLQAGGLHCGCTMSSASVPQHAKLPVPSYVLEFHAVCCAVCIGVIHLV
jgi:hypothetical protein